MYGSKVRASTLCEPSDQANDALIFSFLLYKCGAIVSFIRFGDCIDMEVRRVWCGIGGHIASMDVVFFNEMGGESHLAEVNSDDIIRDKQLKVYAKEPFNCPINSTVMSWERRASNFHSITGSSEK